MSNLASGLFLALLFYGLLLLLLALTVLYFPKSILGSPARAALEWLPPFLGGAALRDWAAAAAGKLAGKRLAEDRAKETPAKLAAELEAAAMQAMLPFADPVDLERVVACPEAGQGRIGVTVPEVLAIADYIRRHKSPTEQTRIRDLARANATKIARRAGTDAVLDPFPCALQGNDRVCCAYSLRPLRCRPLHAAAIAKDTGATGTPVNKRIPDMLNESRHEYLVAQGIEMGVAQALTNAGLDGKIYELNSALATALEMPDAGERWANGENVFHRSIDDSPAT